MAMAKTEKTAEAHDGVGDFSRQLVDHQMIDFANMFAIDTVDFGSLDIIA
jgi:hypothetical protein